MYLVIVEYNRKNARMHRFSNLTGAQLFVKLIQNCVGVVTAYLTNRNQQYQWPTNLVVV